MPTIPNKVQPGDLVTSEFMNSLIDVCADLQERVDGLETPGSGNKKTDITDLLPSGTRRVGDTLHIIGEGFNAPGGNNVMIDSIQIIPSFGPDRDKELIVTIPNLNVGSGGRLVTVLVSNFNGTDTMDFQVYPGVPTLPQGQLFVSLVSGPNGNLTAPGDYIFEYLVRGIVNLAERYTLEASTTVGWQSDIVDASGAVIADPKLDLPAAPPPNGTTARVFVQVHIPDPPGANTAQLKLKVTSTRNINLLGNSGGETLNVGAPGPQPEPITIQYEEITATNPNTQPAPAYIDGVVKIPAGAGKYRLALNAKDYTPNVVYKRRIEPVSDAKWTASFRRTSSLLEETFTPQAGTMETFFVFLSGESGAPDTEVVVRIFNDANANDKGHINQAISLL